MRASVCVVGGRREGRERAIFLLTRLELTLSRYINKVIIIIIIIIKRSNNNNSLTK